MTSPDHRLLLVHAHPDDESIGNGATMAKYVAMGRGVTVVTCTLGEEGEVLVPERRTVLRHGDDLLVVTPRKLREATEARMRQVSDNGRLAQWVGDPKRRDKDKD